jgi:hypothetical protein
LPPSVADTEIGKGYISFKIKPKPGFAVGTIIPNAASIYFDFNFPIVTNTTSTMFESLLKTETFSSTDFTLHPNPTKNLVNISFPSAITILSIAIYNPLGQLIKTNTASELSTSLSIDVSALKTGTYFMEINSNQGKTTKKFVKL